MITIEECSLSRKELEERIDDTEKQIKRFENFVENLKLRKKKFEDKLNEIGGE